MPLWNSNDRESSKPSWLTEEQKRVCFRTVRGWEIPLVGCGYTGSTANPYNQAYVTNSQTFVVPTELLVCLPLDNSATGVTQTDYTDRGLSASVPGATQTDSVNNKNYPPYFTAPHSGAYYRVPFGTTSYIPVIASDVNTTESLQLSFTFGVNPTASHLTLIKNLTSGATASVGAQFAFQTGITNSTYPNGGWGGVTFGAAILQISATLTSGTYGVTCNVYDNRVGNPLTGSVPFTIRVI